MGTFVRAVVENFDGMEDNFDYAALCNVLYDATQRETAETKVYDDSLYEADYELAAILLGEPVYA